MDVELPVVGEIIIDHKGNLLKKVLLGKLPNIDEMTMGFRQLKDLRKRLLIFRKEFTTKILFWKLSLTNIFSLCFLFLG